MANYSLGRTRSKREYDSTQLYGQDPKFMLYKKVVQPKLHHILYTDALPRQDTLTPQITQSASYSARDNDVKRLPG
jgi:hypothetical protein